VSAAELAEDLRRFLADRPIRARRSAVWEQVWRWCRRNPVVAGLSAAVFLLLVVLGIGFMVAELLWTERDRALASQERAEDAERRARAAEQENKVREHLAQAAAYRRIGRVGQRFKALAELTAAVKLDPTPELRRALRNEAIACLLLPDLEVDKEWDGWPVGSSGLAFDAALERYARSDKDGNVSIRRVADDKQLLTLPLPGAGHGVLEFSPDGRLLHQRYQTSKGWRSRLWKLDGRRPISLLNDERFGFSFAFSPDGCECAGYHADGSLRVYETATGKERRRWQSLPGSDLELSWNPKRPLLLAWTWLQQGVRILNAKTGQVEWQVPTTGPVSCAMFHPEGRLLAVTDDHDSKIRLWDIETKQMVLPPLEGHKSHCIVLRFDPSGERLLSNDWSGTWRLWDVHTGRQLLTVHAGEGCLQFNATGTLAAAGAATPRLRTFRYRSGQEFRTLIPRSGPGMGDADLWEVMALDRRGRLLAVAVKDGIFLVDIARGEDFFLLPVVGNTPVAFEPSGALLTSGVSGLLRWPVAGDPATHRRRYGPPQRLYQPVPGNLHGTSTDCRVLAIPNLNRGAIVLHRDENRTVLLGPQEDVRNCAVSPDGAWVASGSHSLHEGGGAKVWRARTGAHERDLPAAGMCPVAFSPPDGKRLATGGGGVRLWEVGTWRPGPVVSGPNHHWFAFAGDGRLLAVQDDPGIVRLVVPETGKELARLTAPVDTQLSPRCFTPDGTQLITRGADMAVHIFDLRAIRTQLAELGLDWDLPPYPPADNADSKPLQVEVDLGDLVAREKYSLILAFFPFHAEAYYQRALAHLRFNQTQEAFNDFSMALNLKADHAQAHYQRALLHLRQGRANEQLPISPAPSPWRRGTPMRSEIAPMRIFSFSSWIKPLPIFPRP
jgi:WD40 repeat protein